MCARIGSKSKEVRERGATSTAPDHFTSLEGLAGLLELIPQPAIVCGSFTGDLLLANSLARSLYGLEADDLGQKTFADLGFIQDGSPSVEAASLLRLQLGQRLQCAVPSFLSHGEVRILSVSASSVLIADDLPCILFVSTDITLPHEVNPQEISRGATLHAIVEANFAVCYEWSLSTGDIVFWGQFDKFLGLDSDETPSTIEDWLSLVHQDDVERVREKNQECIDERSQYIDEYRMVHRDGSYVVVIDSGVILDDESGLAQKMVGGIRNVTEEREMQRALEDRSTALRVLLEQRQRDKSELERNMNENMRVLVMPPLERLIHSLGSRPEARQLESLRQTLEEIAGPFARQLGKQLEGSQLLTPRELEIVHLIRGGKTTSEIAEHLFIAPNTVSYHRTNIRKKLKVAKRGQRLLTHLSYLDDEEKNLRDGLANM